MTYDEMLFVLSGEECGEIQQAASKILRFGKDQSRPKDKSNRTNEDEFLTEYYQLQAVIEYMQRRGTLKTFPASRIQSIKSKKVTKLEKYAAISRSNGFIIE